MSGSFVIDCFSVDRTKKYPKDYAIVAIDVIRATTTATTALYLGREIYPSGSADEAFVLAKSLKDPLLMGEMGGHVPYGFDLTNSPVQVMALSNIPSGYFTNAKRPLILVSSSGMPLVMSSIENSATYLSCLRNYKAVAKYIASRHEKVAVVGAGTRGEFRREDQIGCAWLCRELLKLGFSSEDDNSMKMIERWDNANVDVIRDGNSAKYLMRSGQVHDLEFVLHHVDDLTVVPKYMGTHFEDALRLDN